MIELKIVLGKVEKSNVGTITYHEQTVPIIVVNDILENLLQENYWPVRISAENFTTPICNSQNLQPS